MTLSFVILSLELTLFDKNFDGIVKYNSSKVTLTKNYSYTQCDAGSINGYELTVENAFPCSQRTCLREINIVKMLYVLYYYYLVKIKPIFFVHKSVCI